MKRLQSFPLFALMIIVSSCVPSTTITGTWKNPENNGKRYNRILIVALTDNIQAKQSVENNLANQLQQDGIQNAKSIDLFPPNFNEAKVSHEQILQKVRDMNYDGVLTVTLLDTVTESQYVPAGGMGYAPFGYGYYGSFGGYYNYMYPTIYGQGYYTQDKIYYLETNLYDARTEKLVWSAQSQTYNPSDINNFSKGYAKVTAEKMKNEGVIQ